MPKQSQEEQFTGAVINTVKALFAETMDDNASVIYRKFEEARKAFDGEGFKYSIPVSISIIPVMPGVFDVAVKAAPSSKAKLESSKRINAEKDLVDAMNEVPLKVAESLEKMTRNVGKGIDSVTISTPGMEPVVLDAAAAKNIRENIKKMKAAE